MLHHVQKIILSLFFLLVLLFLFVSCANAEESPAVVVVEVSATPVNTMTPTATPLPTDNATPENPVVIIVPPPLPTTVPDQQAQLEKAREEEAQSVDFVIDMSQLQERSIPFRFSFGENWYKYTSPDGEYSVLLYGSHTPEEGFDERMIFDHLVEVRGVIARYHTDEGFSVITSFDDPLLTSGELTSDEYLDMLADLQPAGVAYFSDAVTSVNIISETQIFINDHPGRDFIIEFYVNENLQFPIPARLRVFVVDNRVYQLFATGLFEELAHNSENIARFLDSFTLNGGEK